MNADQRQLRHHLVIAGIRNQSPKARHFDRFDNLKTNTRIEPHCRVIAQCHTKRNLRQLRFDRLALRHREQLLADAVVLVVGRHRYCENVIFI